MEDFILSIVDKEFTECEHYYAKDLRSRVRYAWEHLTSYDFNGYDVYNIIQLNTVKNPTRVKEKKVHTSTYTYKVDMRSGNNF